MKQNLRQEILSRSDYHRGLLNFIENNPGCTSDDMFNSDVANAIIPIAIREMAITLWIKQFIRNGEIESRNWKLYSTGAAEWDGHNVIKKEGYMRITQNRLKQIIREEYSRLKRQGLIMESEHPGYPDDVTIFIDTNEFYDFDINMFREMSEEREYGSVRISENMENTQFYITGSFDQLWSGWVNTIGDTPEEFMECVVSGHENCPEL